MNGLELDVIQQPTHTLDRQLVQAHLANLNNPKYTEAETKLLKEQIKVLLERENAVLVAHYYTDAAIQELAEETGGCVADSLKMAQFGNEHPADTLIVAGVRFMGETAKILTPEKRVLMPTLEAECSLDLGCPPDKFAAFCDQHPDRTVIVYANTSAAVKARADWVVTSSIALDLLTYLKEEGEKVIWAPDRHLGGWLQRETGADMILWDAACVVHEEFKAGAMQKLKEQMPEAGVLVHPESPKDVVALADAVGSTSQLIKAAKELPHKKFLVATDAGIFYKMRREAPEKEFIAAPTFGLGATCQACSKCPWMAMNSLDKIKSSLETGSNEILVDPSLGREALKPLERMLEFAREWEIRVATRA